MDVQKLTKFKETSIYVGNSHSDLLDGFLSLYFEKANIRLSIVTNQLMKLIDEYFRGGTIKILVSTNLMSINFQTQLRLNEKTKKKINPIVK